MVAVMPARSLVVRLVLAAGLLLVPSLTARAEFPYPALPNRCDASATWVA